MVRCRERSEVPIATDAPQQIASLFDHLVGAGEKRSVYQGCGSIRKIMRRAIGFIAVAIT